MEPIWVPITLTTGDLYEIKMFLALLSDPDNFVNGTAYWATKTHYDSNNPAPFTKFSTGVYREYLKQLYRPYTHILWINKH